VAPVLSVTGPRKTYGDFVAVDGISSHVGRSEIVGLLGPNGAGKTTTINMILGVLWTSHNMYEVEEVCDRVLFLSLRTRAARGRRR